MTLSIRSATISGVTSGGDTPVHPSAWCKANQGWVAVDNFKTDAVVNIPDVKTSNTVLRLWKNGAPASEYFLLENRQQTGFDVSLPGDGLLIWHVDDSQSTNTDEKHYKVALMQADAKRDMERNANRGDAGDPYPGTGNNRNFNATSNPNSKSYANAVTSVAVTGIGVSGATMTAQIQVKGAAGSARPARKPKSKVKKGHRAKKAAKAKTARKKAGRAKAVKKRSARR
jgi:immune inhibitor A